MFLSCLSLRSKDIESLEEPLNKFTGKKYNLFYPKLRFGIESTFKNLFVNEYIGVPTYTCSVVPHAIVLSKNKVRFYDSNKENLTTENYGDETSYIVTPWYGSPLNNNLAHKKYAIGDFSHVNILERKNFFKNNFYVLFFSFNSGKAVAVITVSIFCLKRSPELTPFGKVKLLKLGVNWPTEFPIERFGKVINKLNTSPLT